MNRGEPSEAEITAELKWKYRHLDWTLERPWEYEHVRQFHKIAREWEKK